MASELVVVVILVTYETVLRVGVALAVISSRLRLIRPGPRFGIFVCSGCAGPAAGCALMKSCAKLIPINSAKVIIKVGRSRMLVLVAMMMEDVPEHSFDPPLIPKSAFNCFPIGVSAKILSMHSNSRGLTRVAWRSVFGGRDSF